MKTLLIDIETSPNISYTWFGHHEIDVIEQLEEGYILTFAYKWLGDNGIKAYSLADFKGNKKKLIEKLHELFEQADTIIAHNGNEFDIKWANRSFILHGLTPPSQYKTIDTLKIARSKFKFNSNRLNDLCKYLGIGSKVDTGGFDLWKRCMAGDRKAFKKMVEYNKNDVILLEKIYLKFRGWTTNHPTLYDGILCNRCGSSKLQSRGFATTLSGMYRRFQCINCGGWLRSSKQEEKTNNLRII